MKIDPKEIIQRRDTLIEEYNGLVKDKNPLENFDLQSAVLHGQIVLLTDIIKDGYFDLVKCKIKKLSSEETPDKMFTHSKK